MELSKTKLLFLNREDIDKIINYKDIVDAIEKTFWDDGLGEMIVPRKEIMELGNGNAIFAMPGCLKNLGKVGVKWTSFYPNNPDNFPTIWGHILILSHIHNGQPYAILDATKITNMRTSGGHAVVAAKYLAKKNPKKLGVLGCGAQGRTAIKSFDENFELNQIKVYSKSTGSMEKIRDEMQGQIKAEIILAESVEDLCKETDILVSCTTSLTPLIHVDMLSKGCFIAAMYAFNDIHTDISKVSDKWIMGHKDSDRIEILENENFGDLLNPDDIYGYLGEIVAGKIPGRENDDEIIIFTHMGMGSLDVAIGAQLVEKAKEEGIGQTLTLC